MGTSHLPAAIHMSPRCASLINVTTLHFEWPFVTDTVANFAHAGEEGPADYVWQAVRNLKVDRIDHGVHSVEDPKLLHYLQEHKIPLTVCPISNLKV